MAEPSSPDVFARAQLRLALLFAGIVVALVLVSSVFMYLTVRADLRSAAQRSFGDGETEQEFVTRSLGTLRWQLVAVDGVIIAVIGVVGLLYARSTLRPIRENVAAQKRFIADASHELRTPLAVMKSEFEVSLRQEPQDAEVRRVLVSGLEEVDRMSEMVEDLLTLSRIDAHQERLALGPFDLAELARQTTEKFRTLAAGAGVELAFASDGPAPAVGDARHVGRALSNVVRNAFEHSRSGGSGPHHRRPRGRSGDRAGARYREPGISRSPGGVPWVTRRPAPGPCASGSARWPRTGPGSSGSSCSATGRPRRCSRGRRRTSSGSRRGGGER